MSTELQIKQDAYYADVVSHYTQGHRIRKVMTQYPEITNIAQLSEKYLQDMIAEKQIGEQVSFDRYFKESLLRKVKDIMTEIRHEDRILAKRQAELDHAAKLAALASPGVDVAHVRKKPGRKPGGQPADVEVDAPLPA